MWEPCGPEADVTTPAQLVRDRPLELRAVADVLAEALQRGGQHERARRLAEEGRSNACLIA